MPSETVFTQRLRIIFNLIVLLFPVLGVIFLGWSAFDMVFIYLTEAAIQSYFGIKKQNLVFEHSRVLKEGKKSIHLFYNAELWVFLIFGFFYSAIRLLGSLAHAFNYSKDLVDFRGYPVLSLFLMFALGPVLNNPEILIIMVIHFITSLVDHSRYKRERQYISPADKEPVKVFGRSVLVMFTVTVVFFSIYWFVSLLGDIFGWNTDRFVQAVLAFVLLAVRNAKEILRIVTRQEI